MGLGCINIWIRNKDCKLTDEDGIIRIETCDGRPFTWCEEEFPNFPFKCGHAEKEIPPGCYIVQARTEEQVYTHKAMLIISCDDHICVNLLKDPQMHGHI